MQAARRPIHITRGDTYVHAVTFTDGDGIPADLTGCVYAAQLRASVNVPDALADFTVTDGDATGVVWITLDEAITATLAPGRRVWDLQETGADGNVSTVLGGAADVLADVTRAVAP